MAIQTGAEPFLLPGGTKGVLLIHGFTGSPSEMRLLGDYLHQLGYTVLAVRLCGHGTSVKELRHTNWRHWLSTAENGYYILRGLCSKIAVVGLSMGGLLSLKLAAEYPVSKVVSLSTPIYIADKRLPLLPFYRIVRSYVPKKKHKYNVGDLTVVHYEATPLKSLSSLLELITQVKGLLPEVTAPALIVQSKVEHTVLPKSAQYIYDHLGSKDKQVVWLRRSGHIVTLDVEREKVFAEIGNFLGA